MRVTIWKWLVAILLMCSSGHVQAQSRENSRQAEAKALYIDGKTHFQAGKYNEALASFTASYNLSNEPNLLFNLGITSERLGDRERAIAYYEVYLEELPNAPDAAEVKARLEKLKTAPEPAPMPVAPAPPPQEPARPPIAQTEDELPPDYYGLKEEEEEPKTEVFWPGVPLGIGALLLAGGTITGISAYQKYNDLQDSCSPDCTNSQVKKAKNLALAADILYSGGAVAVVTGFILWISGSGKEKSDKSSLSAWRAVPSGLPGGGGLTVQGRF
ncbi:MAG: tetratricopeptide repeat protein [Deltaproteobacteria bacterium]|nr:tetratricopeptide repeat protein [Deltaproteobacteria bacterium]